MTTPNEMEIKDQGLSNGDVETTQALIVDDVHHRTDKLLELSKSQSLWAAIALSVMGLVRRVTEQDVQEFSDLSDLKAECAKVAQAANDENYQQAA